MYSSTDGMMSDWHLVHLGSFAKGGAGLVVFEASAVVPEGRITQYDAGARDVRWDVCACACVRACVCGGACLCCATYVVRNRAGIWKDEQIGPMSRIVDFIHQHKSAACLQIAHAGRKASTAHHHPPPTT
jgi:2,4-dienoyl-CoA reductase-like NADH-dependent reductase (Old Yellow Enzyme family)